MFMTGLLLEAEPAYSYTTIYELEDARIEYPEDFEW